MPGSAFAAQELTDSGLPTKWAKLAQYPSQSTYREGHKA